MNKPRKKPNMPDLKSELTKLSALKFDDEAADAAPVTVVAEGDDEYHPERSVSHRFYDVIVKHPGSSRAELIELALTMGIKRGSSTSLLSQFRERKLVRSTFSPERNADLYTALRKTYKPGTPATARRKAAERSEAARNDEARQAPAPKLNGHGPTPRAQELLDTLPVAVARELYDGLKKLFGS